MPPIYRSVLRFGKTLWARVETSNLNWRFIKGSKLHIGSLVSATTRSLLKLDQA